MNYNGSVGSDSRPQSNHIFYSHFYSEDRSYPPTSSGYYTRTVLFSQLAGRFVPTDSCAQKFYTKGDFGYSGESGFQPATPRACCVADADRMLIESVQCLR